MTRANPSHTREIPQPRRDSFNLIPEFRKPLKSMKTLRFERSVVRYDMPVMAEGIAE